MKNPDLMSPTELRAELRIARERIRRMELGFERINSTATDLLDRVRQAGPTAREMRSARLRKDRCLDADDSQVEADYHDENLVVLVVPNEETK